MITVLIILPIVPSYWKGRFKKKTIIQIFDLNIESLNQ